jgi:hypothetical protein
MACARRGAATLGSDCATACLCCPLEETDRGPPNAAGKDKRGVERMAEKVRLTPVQKGAHIIGSCLFHAPTCHKIVEHGGQGKDTMGANPRLG